MTLKRELQTLCLDDIHKHDDLDGLLQRMLDQIGSVDHELRDALIYTTFGKLIMCDYLNIKQMEYILEHSLQQLFYEIGQKESDSVFTRSFSALVLALLISKDRQKPFLSEESVLRLIQASIDYLTLEQDIRGYVDGKGWAHSTAHGADLMVEVIKHPLFNPNLSLSCMKAITDCLLKKSTGKGPYMDDEEERLLFAIEALMDKGIKESDLEGWVQELSNSLQDLFELEGYSLNFFWKRSNVIQFLRGLFFRLIYENKGVSLQNKIVPILKHWHNKLYTP